MEYSASQPGSDLPARTVRRISMRLMPFLFCLYLVAYLDRVNVSFAALEMTRDIGMTPAQFGFGAGVFFIGYVLLEIPGALLVETWSARKWIARIMISWGLLAAGTGLIQTATQFYVIRFCLGLAEAGFFPGMIVYLSHWYRGVDRAKAIATFMIAIPMSEILGAPISAFLMKLNWLGLEGWRWLLILEGLPAVVLGIATLLYLTDRPSDARWLSREERDWITSELEREKTARGGHTAPVFRTLREKRVLLLAAGYFAIVNLSYAIVMWLPKILQATYGKSTFTTTLLTALPFLIGTPIVLWIGWHSDRTRERALHCAIPLTLGAAALLIFRAGGVPVVLAILLFAVAVTGMQSAKGPFWAIVTTLLSGRAAAASVGLINSVGNLGGFAGPYTVGWLAGRGDGFGSALLYMVGSSLAAAALVLWASHEAKRHAPQALEVGRV